LVTAVIGLTGTAWADTPADFRRTQIYIQPNLQMSRFVGSLFGEDVGWGVGLGVMQGAQFEWIGFNLTIDTDYYLTHQEPPPFNRSLQVASVRAAARVVYPFRDYRPFLEVAGRRISFISNPLVERSGPKLVHYSLGGAAGVRLLHLSPLYLELRGGWDFVLDLEDTQVLTLGLALGVRSVL
jgi:hypothetical protein